MIGQILKEGSWSSISTITSKLPVYLSMLKNNMLFFFKIRQLIIVGFTYRLISYRYSGIFDSKAFVNFSKIGQKNKFCFVSKARERRPRPEPPSNSPFFFHKSWLGGFPTWLSSGRDIQIPGYQSLPQTAKYFARYPNA